MRPATIRARRPSGALDVFRADHAEIRDGFVVAIGAWRGSRSRGDYAWPARRVELVQWAATA
jgi:hypothetical protein